MSISKIVEGLEVKIKAIESELSATVKKHSGLLGMLQGTKEILNDVKNIESGVNVIPSIEDGIQNAEALATDVKTIVDDLKGQPNAEQTSQAEQDVPQ